MIAELIDAARRGNPSDLDRLVEAIWPHAFRIACSILRDRALAEDVAQEACASAYLGVGKLRCAQAFGVWFYRIVVRQALALERQNPPSVSLEAMLPGGVAALDGVAAAIDVRNALAALPSKQRAAVVLHFYAEMSSREIAAILGMPDSSVRFHLMLAKRSLRQSLGGEPLPVRHLKEAVAGAL